MTTLVLVLAVLASLLHIYIWYLESFAWTGAARAVFGTSAEQAEQTREMAYNQGYYNLFLALIGLSGAVLTVLGHRSAGIALVVAAMMSMAGAAAVLLLGSPDKRAAALKQGTIPALALVVLAVVGMG